MTEIQADIGIIGCGVAGLTAALSCAYHGKTVDIFERAEKVESAIGGGLGLNGGLLGLTKMGYNDVFKDILQPIKTGNYCLGESHIQLEFGNILDGTPLEGHFGFVRRQDIIVNLAKAVKENPKITLRTNHKAVKVTQDGSHATIQFKNENQKSYKSVICADGIHSIGKEAIFPANSFENPDHSGFCVYYGIMSEYPDTMEYPGVYEMDCNGELLLIMPLVNREALTVLLHSRSKQDDPNAWSYSCTVDDLHKHMMEEKIYEKQNLIKEKHIRKLYRLLHLGVYQNKCLPYWSKDRICLIGDAAHATSPALGQGANQAMQDGYLVGKFLSENLNPSDAFRQLFEFRHEDTDAVIKGSQWSARLRSGDMWYARLFRRIIRIAIRINPNILLDQMVPFMTPKFADENFMRELRAVYPLKNPVKTDKNSSGTKKIVFLGGALMAILYLQKNPEKLNNIKTLISSKIPVNAIQFFR